MRLLYIVAALAVLAVGLGVFVWMSGDPPTTPSPPSPPAAAPAGASPISADIMLAGGEVFASTCAPCHGETGQGDVGPALAGNGNLAIEGFVPTMILFGGSEMPGFADTLDDEAIAAVATYVRNSWGNAFGPVSAETVAARR